jgi:hypothetical protein
MDGEPVDDRLPSRLVAIHATIQSERNMQHVRAWKEFAVETTNAGSRDPDSSKAQAAAPANALNRTLVSA